MSSTFDEFRLTLMYLRRAALLAQVALFAVRAFKQIRQHKERIVVVKNQHVTLMAKHKAMRARHAMFTRRRLRQVSK
jgi:hypothetical protein